MHEKFIRFISRKFIKKNKTGKTESAILRKRGASEFITFDYN